VRIRNRLRITRYRVPGPKVVFRVCALPYTDEKFSSIAADPATYLQRITQVGMAALIKRDAHEVPEGERKTVTALFADIKGSTELMADLDPEEARTIIDPALRLMMDAAHRYDGYVVQSTGDGIFVLFGAPVAHEDHPQRALYAALRMQEELRRYSAKVVADGGIPR
jgi:class 3 adenylate cyclase